MKTSCNRFKVLTPKKWGNISFSVITTQCLNIGIQNIIIIIYDKRINYFNILINYYSGHYYFLLKQYCHNEFSSRCDTMTNCVRRISTRIIVRDNFMRSKDNMMRQFKRLWVIEINFCPVSLETMRTESHLQFIALCYNIAGDTRA